MVLKCQHEIERKCREESQVTWDKKNSSWLGDQIQTMHVLLLGLKLRPLILLSLCACACVWVSLQLVTFSLTVSLSMEPSIHSCLEMSRFEEQLKAGHIFCGLESSHNSLLACMCPWQTVWQWMPTLKTDWSSFSYAGVMLCSSHLL